MASNCCDTPEAGHELQMGAVSGLGDMESDHATQALLGALSHLEGGNRDLAIEALLRSPQRAGLFNAAIARGDVVKTALSPELLERIRVTAGE